MRRQLVQSGRLHQTAGMESKDVLIVAGPTGSGKSGLALAAAEAFAGTVINADSAQVYQELRVLTARPDADAEARALHRLYGVLTAPERCSAGRWLAMAAEAVRETWKQGRLPIVVGGTGLYLRALTDGLAPVPPVPDAVRAEAEALYASLGGTQFREQLASLDADSAATLHPSDRQRLVRAMEVVRTTGQPLGYWQRQPPVRALPGARFTTLVLRPERRGLYATLDARFLAMLDEGALDEVASLRALRLDSSLPVMKALGVRELAAVLSGEQDLASATALAQRATRRFAKRQITWLRHQVPADAVFFEQYSERINGKIFAFIRRQLLTRDD